MNASMSPSMTAWMLPVSTPVRRSFTIWYGCTTYDRIWLPQAISFKSALRMGRGLGIKPLKASLDDIAVLQYTGGTTGLAKGAMLTHGNLVANMQQAAAWVGTVAILMIYIVVVALIVVPFYRFVGKFDWVTAYFAGMPGGLNEMIEIGEAKGADVRSIILAHSLRIVVTIALIAVCGVLGCEPAMCSALTASQTMAPITSSQAKRKNSFQRRAARCSLSWANSSFSMVARSQPALGLPVGPALPDGLVKSSFMEKVGAERSEGHGFEQVL